MAIVKLVCQGCGANLDASDGDRVIQCGYCGTSNQIKQTVQPTATPVQAPNQYAPPPVQFNVSSASQRSGGAGKLVLIIVLLSVFLPLGIVGFVVYSVVKTTTGVLEQVGFKGGALGGDVNARKYGWTSARPFVADVNGDGVDDIVGTITEVGSQQLLLTAMSGSDWSTLWEVDLGRQSDLPNPTLYFEPGTKLVLFGLGATLHAYDAGSGAQRWVASLPDKAEQLALDGEQLWVATIDGAGHQLNLADGKLSPGAAKPPATATALRDAEGYELIRELGELDLKSKQFDDLRVESAFCPEADLPVVSGRRQKDADKRCANANGLAFATRAKGTKVPFLLGYDPQSKAERWRVQLTQAGSLETVDSGFGQPRAEFVGEDAIVSFVPSNDNNARIRRISLGDGATKWETMLTRGLVENIDGMVVGEGMVFVTYGQNIQVLSLDSGEQLAQLGGW